MSEFRLSSKTIAILIFSLKFWSVEPNAIDCEPGKTALAEKQGIRDYNDSIALGTITFNDLVKKSKIFVDKSFVIAEFLMFDSKLTMLICPPKWGKTTNIDMLKTFLQIQVDEHGNQILPKESTTNYRLFAKGEIVLDNGRVEKLLNPLLIASQADIMNSYLGQYPVVYISFKNAVGETGHIIKNKIRLEISKVFKQHEYLLERLEKKSQTSDSVSCGEEDPDIRRFKDYRDKNASVNIEQGLTFLCQLLYGHFRKNSFLIMDDYDAPLHSFVTTEHFSPTDLREFSRFWEKFILDAFSNNCFLQRGILTGIFELNDKFDTSWDKYTVHHVTYENSSLREFFGFKHSDVQMLFNKHEISQELSEKARKWYSGYESLFSNQPFYHIPSVISFIKEKRIDCYWKETNNMKRFAQHVIKKVKSSGIRYEIILLLARHTASADERFHLNVQGIEVLRRVSSQKKELHFRGIWFCTYLFGEGYLTKVTNEEVLPHYSFVHQQMVLPTNLETSSVLIKWLVAYYKQRYQIQEAVLQNASTSLLEFIESDSNDAKSLEESWTNLYQKSSPHMDSVVNTSSDESYVFINDNPAHAVLNCIILNLQSITKFEIEAYCSRTQYADVVIAHRGIVRGVVVELADDILSADEVREVAVQRKAVFKTLIDILIREVKVIGIYVAKNYSIQVSSRFVAI